MIVRALDPYGDYQLGIFLTDTPAAVAQVVATRLALWEGDWFLDTTSGTPYFQDILGRKTNYDLEIQARILETPGVTEITSYSSSVSARGLYVDADIDTIYGPTSMSATL
ncbi:MAG: hypothetical protein VST70_01710 [Nitrospirota bacterium]|nr:hypothetical protein [Nitrospirota bacterium]